ncbi:unnamed protein product [Rhodiola kirilowii]
MADSTTLRQNNQHIVKKRRLHETDPPTFDFFSRSSSLTSLSLTTTNPSFRDNVRWFCRQYGELETYRVDGFRVWLTLLVNPRNGVVFPLYLVEEVVQALPDYFCVQCICAGWGNHFVSKRRYHLIVPEVGGWGECLKNGALSEGQHLLHGMIHCNGFGHLLSMNGIDTNATCLSSEEVMELFDVMCRLLRTRKVTVRDELSKGQMELRLLHIIAYGKSWYGEWGYKFCRGSFGVTEQKYNRSIELLTSLDISKVLSDFSGDEVLNKIIRCYKDECETQLTTISELLDFMLAYKSIHGAQLVPKAESVTCTGPPTNIKKELTSNRVLVSSPKKSSISKYTKLSSWAEMLDCRYPKKRLQSAAQTVVGILKGGQNGVLNDIGTWQMGRHELREIMRQHVGDTGLIDFVLKSINKVIVGDNIVHRIYNSGTKKLEFAIESLKGSSRPISGNDIRNETALQTPLPERAPNMVIVPGADVDDDISYIYRCIVRGYKHYDPVALASQAIIDSKLFVKEWKLEEEVDDNISTWVVCRVLPSYDELTRFLPRPLPPGEIIKVAAGIKMKHLKSRLQSALRDTYSIMDEFVVKEVLEYEKGEQLGMHVWVKGSGLDLDNTLTYEAGSCNWKVHCHKCGIKEDDGEDMVWCAGCKVLMHARCIGIGNLDQSENFLCSKCRI